ncbi:MAG: hypothetical protein V4629_11755 [Pseudomonadota bacterium]
MKKLFLSQTLSIVIFLPLTGCDQIRRAGGCFIAPNSNCTK